MDSERWSDLVSEMYTLVREQTFLHEVTGPVTDLYGDEREVVHGPWLASECQSVLTPWHQAGWIEFIADADAPLSFPHAMWSERATREGAYLVLTTSDAIGLLQEPSRWIVNTADGHVMLCLSDEGARHGYSEWLALTERGGPTD